MQSKTGSENVKIGNFRWPARVQAPLRKVPRRRDRPAPPIGGGRRADLTWERPLRILRSRTFCEADSCLTEAAVVSVRVGRVCDAARVVVMQGTVKWFNDSKGFGFITPSDGSPDVFVHYSDVQGEGRRSLREGEEVEFETTQGDRGPKATNVRTTT